MTQPQGCHKLQKRRVLGKARRRVCEKTHTENSFSNGLSTAIVYSCISWLECSTLITTCSRPPQTPVNRWSCSHSNTDGGMQHFGASVELVTGEQTRGNER